MPVILGMLAMLLVYGGPVIVGAWIGSRVQRGWIAFILGWVVTPVAGFVLAFVAESIAYASNPSRSGGGLLVIVLPLICVFTGLIAGIAAVLVVELRKAKAAPSLPEIASSPGIKVEDSTA